MLYSFDGTTIERRAVKSKYWAKGLLAKFNELKKSEKELKEPLRDWGQRATQRATRRGRLPREATIRGPADEDDWDHGWN